MNGKIVALATVGLMLAGQAVAAEAQISSINGSVVASQNGQFSPASESMALSTGDRLIAREGSAQVSFADGCVVTLKANSMLTVDAASPCASGAGLISATDGDVAQIGNSGFTTALLAFAGLSVLLLVVGDSENDDVLPVSP
jgi:hypothetical protein